MNDIYTPPKAEVDKGEPFGQNNSGLGKVLNIPEGVKGWSWGAFFLTWIWAIGNRTWIGLLALLPFMGLIMMVVLGVKGREWAWQNKRWDSVEHFQRVQRLWTICALVLMAGLVTLYVLVL